MNQAAVPPTQVVNFFSLLKTKLVNVPEAQSALALAEQDPADTYNIYQGYLEVIFQIPGLDERQLDIIRRARDSLNKGNGAISASHSDAKDLLEQVSGKVDISESVLMALDPTSEYFLRTVTELAGRLEGGHQMKISGKQPVDGDPESDRIIWGHTKMNNALALLHFIICHYLERYISETLKDHEIAIGYEKDYFLNAMTDVLILDSLDKNHYKTIFELWLLPKDQGGLGWISPEMVAAYQ